MLLDLKFTQALKRRTASLCILCEVDHPDGVVRLWSGIGALQYGGHTWAGAGVLGSITTAARTSELRVDEVRLSLSGVNAHDLAEVSMEIRNRIAKTWLAAVAPGNQVVGVLLLDEILLDYATESIAENGQAVITLIGQAGFWTLERSTETVWSPQEAALRWGEGVETGFDYIPSLRMKDTTWEPPTS
jgi:hypothetical protein